MRHPVFYLPVLLALLAGVAQAETIPAIDTPLTTETQTRWPNKDTTCTINNYGWATAQEAADAAWNCVDPMPLGYCTVTKYPGATLIPYTETQYYWIAYYNKTNCTGGYANGDQIYDNDYRVGRLNGCPTGYAPYGTGCIKHVYSCPAEGTWTLEGASCTRPDCAEGTYRDQLSGACRPEKDLGEACGG